MILFEHCPGHELQCHKATGLRRSPVPIWCGVLPAQNPGSAENEVPGSRGSNFTLANSVTILPYSGVRVIFRALLKTPYTVCGSGNKIFQVWYVPKKESLVTNGTLGSILMTEGHVC